MKVSIVGGAGVVGASAAYRLAQDGWASEIVLMDKAENAAEAHALDIGQAVVNRTGVRVRAGGAPACEGSDVVIMTAGVPHRFSVTSRAEFLKENVPLVAELAGPCVKGSPEAVWIVATVPVDPLVHLIHSRFSVPREKVLGLNNNDTCRFRWAIARTLSVPSTRVEAFVLGEHGETQVPLFSRIRVDGEPVTLTPEQVARVKSEISGFFAEWTRLNPGRTAGWTSAESLGDLVAGMASGDGRILPCSTPLEGEYGMAGVSLGVPVRLGEGGVEEIVRLDLAPEEERALEHSSSMVREQIETGEALFSE